MQRFLLKTEPSEFSFDDLVKAKTTVWNGVSNPVALKYIRTMKKGDSAFIYHTGKEKQIVGTCKIICNAYSDPNDKDERLFVVELKAGERLTTPVSLATIKSMKEFNEFLLVKISRLSVMPVTTDQWNMILSLRGGSQNC